MRNIISIMLGAALLASCGPMPQQHRAKKFHVEEKQVYHFADGRVGYHDDSMIWYWLVLQQNSNINASSPTIVGGWSKGPAPSQAEIEEAETQTQGIVETETGEPVDATEAEAVASAEPSLAETAPDAVTGEISSSITVSSEASAETGSAGEASASTDSGSSGGDSGGGGDGGGGGGE